MNSRHFTKFGSYFSPSGGLYVISDEDGLIRMDMDMELIRLKSKGVPITRDTITELKRDIQKKRASYHDKVSQAGIPDKLKPLLQITKKAELEKYCRDLTVSEYDLFLLIHNCNQIQYNHRSKFKEFMPDHLKFSDTDRYEMKTGNLRKAIRKVSPSIQERRCLHIHLFEYSTVWHYFYFSHQDVNIESTNHWKYGCHIHFVNYLWTEYSKSLIWKIFNKRNNEISGNLHIRFSSVNYSDQEVNIKSDLNRKNTLPPYSFAYNPEYATEFSSIALPVRQLITRGIWAVTLGNPELT
jgi:hypothetical protein